MPERAKVYLIKQRRFTRENGRRMLLRAKNGKPLFVWALRWRIDGVRKWEYQSTGTADKVQAEVLRKRLWEQLNGIIPAEPEPVTKPSWQECRDAAERSMKADNLRPRYVDEALLTFDSFQRMFPAVESPADVTPAVAQSFKEKRAELKLSPWTIKSDLAKLRAIFGKLTGDHIRLLRSNPFEKITPPVCEDPEVRIITPQEYDGFLDWLNRRWNNWRLPVVYLELLSSLGWRATETASIREQDLLDDCVVRVIAPNSKTRRDKYGHVPADLYADLKGCCANGFALGKFCDDLRRLHTLWRQRHCDARLVSKTFVPHRLVYWMQHEVDRYQKETPKDQRFSLHDFRRTAITNMQSAGVSEKLASLTVGCTPQVMRKHYERLEKVEMAKQVHQLTQNSTLARRPRAS